MVPPDGSGTVPSRFTLGRRVTGVTVLFVEFAALRVTSGCGTMRGMRLPGARSPRGGESPVARQILLLQVLVVLVVVVVAVGFATYDARHSTREHARDQAVAVAESVADSPTVRSALRTAEPCAVLQPYAEA